MSDQSVFTPTISAAEKWRHSISTNEYGDLEIHIFCCSTDTPLCFVAADDGRDRPFSFKHKIRIKAICRKPSKPKAPAKRKSTRTTKQAVKVKEEVSEVSPLPESRVPSKDEPVEPAPVEVTKPAEPSTVQASSTEKEAFSDSAFLELDCDEGHDNGADPDWEESMEDSGQTLVKKAKRRSGISTVGRNPDKLAKLKTRECKFCHKIFPNHMEYWAHRRNPHYDKSMCKENKKCEICKTEDGKPVKFATKAALMAHHCVHHTKDPHLTSVKQDVEETGQTGDLLGKYPCPICTELFGSEWTLHIHLKHHTREHLYVCCLCNQPLSHWDKHSCSANPKRFKCGECSDRFASRTDLAEHRRNVHDHTCFYCGKEFFSRVSRNQHLEMEHSKDGVRCQVCNKILKNEACLHDHMRHHKYKGAKQECPVCGILVFQLKNHINMVHNQSKPLVCDQCPKICYSTRAFKAHMSRHSNTMHSCDYCPKQFTNRRTLARHLHIHTKIRSYICETCGHKSTTSGNLQIHRRIHMPVKMFPCPCCEKSFNYKASLQSHMKSQHQTQHAFL